MFSFEELNAKINRLKREGGVGYTEPGKSITWDGNTEGKVIVGGFYVLVSAEPIDLTSVKSVSYTIGDEIFTTESDHEAFLVQSVDLLQVCTIADDPIAFVCMEEHYNELFETTIQKGTYFAYRPLSYTTEVKIAETIHPISDKYLPGVCLPVVELTTVPTGDGAALTDAENAVLTKAYAGDLPIVCKLNAGSVTLSAVFAKSAGSGMDAFSARTAIGSIVLRNDEGTWTALAFNE